MRDEIQSLFSARKGHFRYESGHHGDLWLDVPNAFVEPRRMRSFANTVAATLAKHDVQVVCGPMVEGSFLAQMVAEDFGAQFIWAEQFTRSSEGIFPIGYRISQSLRNLVSGKRVAVVDDVINAGSAVRGAIEDLRVCGGKLTVLASLMTLGPQADQIAESNGVPLVTLSRITESNLWEPANCPLCEARVPLDGVMA